jgi:hypothetical protein
MWRHPDESPEGAQEVIGAHRRLTRQRVERERLLAMRLDMAQRARDPALVARARRLDPALLV